MKVYLKDGAEVEIQEREFNPLVHSRTKTKTKAKKKAKSEKAAKGG